jgi:hypothetical protein
LQWSQEKKAAIQETYWHSPWSPNRVVKSSYFISMEQEDLWD